jgi:hypothetical protein
MRASIHKKIAKHHVPKDDMPYIHVGNVCCKPHVLQMLGTYPCLMLPAGTPLAGSM